LSDNQPFVFGVDLDGVCGDYTAAFRKVAAEELGVPVDSLPLERSWDFHEWGFGPGDYERIHRIAVLERRILRDLPIIDGAAETLWRLSDAGVWIRVITHRLYVNWSHATRTATSASSVPSQRSKPTRTSTTGPTTSSRSASSATT
jgi:5'-nucleotidase